MNEEMIFVYILKLANNKYYTGITGSLARRMREHRNGNSKSTRKHLPLKLMYYTEAKDRLAARTLEKKIKNRGAKRYLLDTEYKNTTYENKIL